MNVKPYVELSLTDLIAKTLPAYQKFYASPLKGTSFSPNELIRQASAVALAEIQALGNLQPNTLQSLQIFIARMESCNDRLKEDQKTAFRIHYYYRQILLQKFKNALVSNNPALLVALHGFPDPLNHQANPISGIEKDFVPSSSTLNMFLNDYIGPYGGGTTQEAIEFFKHYLHAYTQLFTNNQVANAIQGKLLQYVDTNSNSLEQEANAILDQLQRSGKVTFSAHKTSYWSGHVAFCELEKDENGTINFSLTNTGEGIRYHPCFNLEKKIYYRTLRFLGSSLEDLIQSRFVELLLSLASSTMLSIYQVIYHAWPGCPKVIACNPGIDQTGGTCSVQAIVKWMKHFSGSRQLIETSAECFSIEASNCAYQHMNVWIKLKALDDYLEKASSCDFALIENALPKISAKCSKMLAQDILDPYLKQLWQDVAKKGKTRLYALEKDNFKPSSSENNEALFFAPMPYEEGYSDDELQVSKDCSAKVSLPGYAHVLFGQHICLSAISELSQQSFSSPKVMAQCLNFLRSLPGCEVFVYETSIPSDTTLTAENFYTELGKMLQKFHIQNDQDFSLHMPDSFMPDVMNAWLILYFHAKSYDKIPVDVLFDWISALELIVNTYQLEYIFDTKYSWQRFLHVAAHCQKEKATLISCLQGSEPEATAFHWQIWDKTQMPSEGSNMTGYREPYAPFLNWHNGALAKEENLPPMAKFAFKVVQSTIENLDAKKISTESLPKEFCDSLMDFRSACLYYNDDKRNFSLAIKCSSYMLPTIPYYDALRKSLANLFLCADRNIYLKSNNLFIRKQSSLIRLSSRGLESLEGLQTYRPKVGEIEKYFPETCLANLSKKAQPHNCNVRIQTALTAKNRALPFFSKAEEVEWCANYQPGSIAGLLAGLRFFRKYLSKLHKIEYQAVLEHMLFSVQGYQALTALFQQPENIAFRKIFFDFFEHAYASFLSNDKSHASQSQALTNWEGSAAFLLHIHARLMALLCALDKFPTLELNRFYQQWDLVLQACQSNPHLRSYVAEALLSALSSLETASQLYSQDEFLMRLCACMLSYGFAVPLPYNRYALLMKTYGLHVFKSLINGVTEQQIHQYWQAAAKLIFGITTLENYHWDKLSGLLLINERTISIYDQAMCEEHCDYMRPIPSHIQKKCSIFGQDHIIALFRSEQKKNIYTFQHEGFDYEIKANKRGTKFETYKKIDGAFYQLELDEDNLSAPSYFSSCYHYWIKDHIIYAEHDIKKTLGARFDGQHWLRLHHGEPTGEVLVQACGPMSNMLRDFIGDDKPHPKAWQDAQGKITLIMAGELEFIQQDDFDGQTAYYSLQVPGFKIAHNQSLAFIEKGSFLLLENKLGMKKAICGDSVDNMVFDCRFIDGKLVLDPANSVPKIFNLTYHYLEEEHYQLALETIKHAGVHQNRFTSKQALSTLHIISKYRSCHPKALAVKQYALCWLERCDPQAFDDDLLNVHLLRCAKVHNHLPHMPQGNWQDNFEYPSQEARPNFLFHMLSTDTLGVLPETLISKYEEYTQKHAPLAWHAELKLDFYAHINESANNFLVYVYLIRYGSQADINKIKPTLLRNIYLAPSIYTSILIGELAKRSENQVSLSSQKKAVSLPENDIWDSSALDAFLDQPYLDDFMDVNEIAGTDIHMQDFVLPDMAWKDLDLFNTAKEYAGMPQKWKQHLVTYFHALDQKYSQTDIFYLLYGPALIEECRGERISFPLMPKMPTSSFELPRIHFLHLVTYKQLIDIEGQLYVTAPIPIQARQKVALPFAKWCEEQQNCLEPLLAKRFQALSVGAKRFKALSISPQRLKALNARAKRSTALHAEAKTTATPALTAKILTSNKFSIDNALSAYEKAISDCLKVIVELEATLLAKANADKGHIGYALELACGKRSELDLQTLLVSFARRDRSIIEQHNPVLSHADIYALMCQVGRYALLKCELQRLQRAALKLAEYRTALAEGETACTLRQLSDEYQATSQATHRYHPEEHPHLLVFELFSDLIIRQEQLNMLYNWMDNPCQLFGLRTNMGKSKVIAPLFMMCMAPAEGVVINIIPSVLYEAHMAHMQSIFKRAEDYFAFCIEFNRHSPCTAQDIEFIYETFQQAKALKRPIFMSDTSAHNLFVLKLKELCQAQSSSDDFASLRELLLLRRFVKEHAHVLIEEPHLVLDDAQESNYSLGMPKPFNATHRHLCIQLYAALLVVIQDRWHVDFWNASTMSLVVEEKMNVDSSTLLPAQLAPLTEEAYRQEVLPQLLQKMLEMFHCDESGKQLTYYGHEICTSDLSSTSLTWPHIEGYLRGEMSFKEQEAFELLLKASVEDIKADSPQLAIRLLHDQLHYFLPQTLSQNVGEHYALADELVRTAQPLENARQAKENAEFVSPDQVINFTIQANLKIDFSRRFLLNYLQQLNAAATEELKHGKEKLSETLTYKKWQALISHMDVQLPNPFKMNHSEIDSFIQGINHNLKVRLKFIELNILPMLRSFNEKASSTPHLFVDCFKAIYGSSGTLTMQNLPHALKVHSHPKGSVDTILDMLKIGQPHPQVVELAASNSRQILYAFAEQFPSATVAIEIGAVFRDYQDLLQIAEDALEALPHMVGVVTFDAQGAPQVLLKGARYFIPKEAAVVDEHKLFWLYAQKDITGTDQKLTSKAHGVAFINQYTTLTELVQGVSRMRGLSGQQTIQIGLDQESCAAIKHRLNFPPTQALQTLDIIKYCLMQECHYQGQSNIRSLTLQSDALLENHFWTFVQSKIDQDEDSLEEAVKDIQAVRSLLIENTEDIPLLRPTLSLEKMPTELVLERLARGFETKVNLLLASLQTRSKELQQFFTQCDFNIQRGAIQKGMDYPLQTHLISSTAVSQVTETTAEQCCASTGTKESAHAEAFAEEQNETAAFATTRGDGMWMERRPLPYQEELHFYPLAECFMHATLKKFRPLFADSHLYISANAIATLEGDALQSPGWVNGYIKQLSYLAEVKENTFVLMDHAEAMKRLHNAKVKLWMINHGPLYNMDHDQQEQVQAHSVFQNMELAAKLLNGDVQFNPCQWEFLTLWLQGKQSLLKSFLQDVLVPLHPELPSLPDYQRLIEMCST